jgi:multidrug efflux system membrane fusion protein
MRAGVKLPVIAFDRDLKKKLASGTLLTIDNQIDQASGTVRFKGQFESVEVREITTSLTEGDEASVDKGLEAGDVVVIDGIDKLERGTKVVVRMAPGKK